MQCLPTFCGKPKVHNQERKKSDDSESGFSSSCHYLVMLWHTFKQSWKYFRNDKDANKLFNVGLMQHFFRSSHIFAFGFWYFGHFSCVIFFPVRPSCPSCLAKCKQRLCNISDQKPKTKKWDERNTNVTTSNFQKANFYLGCSRFLTLTQKGFYFKSNP